MEAHVDVGVLGCRVLNGDGSLQRSCSCFPGIPSLLILTSGLWKLPWPPFFDRYHLVHWPHDEERDVEVISGCFMFVRARCLESVGLLDESFFFFGEEVDWCRRFRQAGWVVRFAPLGEITHFGGGSTQSIGYEREILLSKALVMLNRKYGGALAAAMAWFLLLVFNASRAACWAVCAIVLRSNHAREKRDRFFQITRDFGRTWPRQPVEM